MLIVFTFSIVMIVYPLVIYPLCLASLSVFYKKQEPLKRQSENPAMSIIVVVRNGEAFIADKLANCLALDYPRELVEIIVASDGSTDRTLDIANSFLGSGIKTFQFTSHLGKNATINKIVPEAKGELLVFTDVAALMSRNALTALIPWFTDPEIGGVCAKKTLSMTNSALGGSQTQYSAYEDFIRACESRIASIASNEGFFYAMRQDLFRPLPEYVTDDLYNAMSIIKQRKRMVYDVKMTAMIPVRAKNAGHELERRKRIVCQSLWSIWLQRKLLNPFDYGVYSWILFSHKVLRRALPVLLVSLFVSNLFLLSEHPAFMLMLILQITGLAIALAKHFNLLRPKLAPRITEKIVSAWYYFCLGNLGTLIGVYEFLLGKKYSKWDPLKSK